MASSSYLAQFLDLRSDQQLSNEYVSQSFRVGVPLVATAVWVAAAEGLHRFREIAVPTVSGKQGLPDSVWSVLATKDGSVWLGTRDALRRWQNGHVTIYRTRRATLRSPCREIIDSGLPDGEVESLFEHDGGRLWVATGYGIASLENGRFTALNVEPGGPRR
jgi:ligand-binding sensor domain-containing protein